jgi:hypothetical protein
MQLRQQIIEPSVRWLSRSCSLTVVKSVTNFNTVTRLAKELNLSYLSVMRRREIEYSGITPWRALSFEQAIENLRKLSGDAPLGTIYF